MLLRLLVVCLFPSLAMATAQIAETIVLDSHAMPLLEAPLEDFWSSAHPKSKSLSALSTGCYRGYFGTWEVRGDRLFLLNIERKRVVRTADGDTEEQSIPVSKKAVLGAKSEAPFIADWFSGVLPVAHGIDRGYIRYDHECPEIEYIYVAHGRVIRRITVHNFESPTAKPIVERESAWDGAANKDAATARPGDNWAMISYVWSNYEQVVDHGQTLRLRGVYFPGKIWFPPSESAGTFRIVIEGGQELPAVGSNIEITTVVKAHGGPLYFVVSKITVLPASEPIRR